MKPFIVVFAVLAALTLPGRAFAQAAHHADSPKADLHLSEPLVVGTTTLEPGDYKFQCRTIDDKQFLVVTTERDGNEVARVPCTAEDLPAKVKTSEFRSKTQANGPKVLSSVRIKGETLAHRVVE